MNSVHAAIAKRPLQSCKMSISGFIVGATLLVIACASHAELNIPNPLIKPQQITPISANDPKDPAISDPKSPMAARNLPGLSPNMPPLPGGSFSDAEVKKSGEHLTNDALRIALANYQVTVLSGEHALLRYVARAGAPGSSQPGSSSSSNDTSANSTNNILKQGLPQVLRVQNDGKAFFMGEFLQARMSANTVELYRFAKADEGKDKKKDKTSLELVFVGGLEFSSTPAYVPDTSKLEKTDLQYRRSVAPENVKSTSVTAGDSSSSQSTPMNGTTQ